MRGQRRRGELLDGGEISIGSCLSLLSSCLPAFLQYLSCDARSEEHTTRIARSVSLRSCTNFCTWFCALSWDDRCSYAHIASQQEQRKP